MYKAVKIMPVTGHKSVQSLTVYQRTDTEGKIENGTRTNRHHYQLWK